ncbi:ATP-binding protein [Sulfuricurvum sp.]|uniref:ATP-binding protein n=1 Tax=Sulfuricurvum sp. TaxID=2025608 RepID=UPI002E37428F|nr:ATP-binding protein [Sulfuricurvum sp.]HEX5330215.1 ATP-binding protein [Sulfuricurvum sp.]
MKFRWNSLPIVYKLFIALFGVIALIIFVLLSYLWGHESNLLLKKEQENIHNNAISVAKDLDFHLSNLRKEIVFLSRLEVMNDMVTRDMDKRIASILDEKASDFGNSMSLFTIAPDLSIPAASEDANYSIIQKDATAIVDGYKRGKSYIFLGKNLYFFAPIRGTFYPEDILGYLVLSFPLENFVHQLETDKKLFRWLTPPSEKSIIYSRNNPVFDADAYLHHSIALKGVLKGWVLHYALPKSEALALLYHFQTLFLIGFGVGIILIALLLWVLLLRIIKPLHSLSDTAMQIATTGDYTQTVAETGTDEVGMMAHSFNALMFRTQVMMERLRVEREKHWEKLVSLIVFFNAVSRADTKESTIEIAIHEIRRFSNAKAVYYSCDGCNDSSITIALNAVGNDTSGFICIEEAGLSKETNERFYEALERMLSLQMERIELLEKTQAALMAKSSFLSAMSHELRTPLGSILSLTQYMMTHSKTPEPQFETLGKIENSAHHLLDVINTILDLAKAESGKLEPHTSRCDLVQLIESALELVVPLAEEKGLRIITALEPVEREFNTDERLFGQVVINLLSNAIKFTENGIIEVQLNFYHGLYVLQVKDSGCGIAKGAIENLFDEFYQVRRNNENSTNGSGLGLAISKRIALVLNGDLVISSEGEGKGTTASFNFRSF